MWGIDPVSSSRYCVLSGGAKKFELSKCEHLLVQNVPFCLPGPWGVWGCVILDHGAAGRARAGPVSEVRHS